MRQYVIALLKKGDEEAAKNGLCEKAWSFHELCVQFRAEYGFALRTMEELRIFRDIATQGLHISQLTCDICHGRNIDFDIIKHVDSGLICHRKCCENLKQCNVCDEWGQNLRYWQMDRKYYHPECLVDHIKTIITPTLFEKEGNSICFIRNFRHVHVFQSSI